MYMKYVYIFSFLDYQNRIYIILNYFLKSKNYTYISMKIVVFDLDETLGYFVELGIFIDCLKRYIFKFNKNLLLTQNDFNDIINLYTIIKQYKYSNYLCMMTF